MLGIVAIGRNEGERLRLCLESIATFDVPKIYVDSNSSDDSVRIAEGHGIAVLELDPTKPCSAARARREGFRALTDEHPQLEFVFFVDGDCQVDASWPETAIEFLREHDDVGVVCGRRRELHPERSVYNRICDAEWDTPVGEAQAVGGDAVYRCQAYRDAGEFDPTVPAGEEPELCKRVRDAGWRIWRMDAEMTVHDAAMTRAGQWWRRQLRTGYAGFDVERRFQLGIFDRIIKSAFFWGIGLPLATVLVSTAFASVQQSGVAITSVLAAVSIACLQIVRIAWRSKSANYNWVERLQFGFFTMAAKLPIALGALRQIFEAALGKQAQLVEYKSAAENLKPHA